MSKVTLIIGASSDLGLALIESFTDDRVILAHYHSSIEGLLSLSKSKPSQIKPMYADLSSVVEVNSLLDEIEENYGMPDEIVFLAAGKLQHKRFKDLEWTDFSADMDISLKSTFLVLHRFLPMMAKKKRGKVVVMLTSVLLGVPPKALTHYTTVKSALLGLVRSTAAEYASKNIQINAVSPSMIETKFLSGINEKYVELGAYNHPLRRNAATNDVTPIIRFLLSNDSDYINGVNVPITGGSIF